MKKLVFVLLCVIIMISCVPVAYSDDASLRISLANQILANENIVLSTTNSAPKYQGQKDGADAKQNIIDTAAGKKAKRSSYADTDSKLYTPAPGGEVYLSVNLLRAIVALENRYGKIQISHIVGGCHSSTSKHYRGIAMDLTYIGGSVTTAKGKEIYQYLTSLGFIEGKEHGESVYENSSHYHIAITGYTPSDATATLDVNGYLDGSYSGNIDGYGTFDLYIKRPGASSREQVVSDGKDFCQDLPQGTEYWIEDIQPINIHDYMGAEIPANPNGAQIDNTQTSITGKIGNGDTTVLLKFRTNLPGVEIPSVGSNDFYAHIRCKNGLYLSEQDDFNVTGYPLTERADWCQIWHFEILQDNWYKITSVKTGKALYCPPENGWIDGTNLVTGDYKSNFTDQRWALHLINGSVQIGSGAGFFVIDAGYPVEENYNNVYMLHEDGPNNNNQLFNIEIVGTSISFDADSYSVKSGQSTTVTISFIGNGIQTIDMKVADQGMCTATLSSSKWVAYPGTCTATYTITGKNLGTTALTFCLLDSSNKVITQKSVNITVSGYYLDLNGQLDGTFKSNLTGFGKVDIYINGTLVSGSGGAEDYYIQWPSGTKYEFKNPRAQSGYKYNGVSTGTLTGTIGTQNVLVALSYSTLNKYTISYNANSGSGAPANQTKIQDTALTLSSTKPTRASSSAGSYTVTFNANGGSVSQTSMTSALTTNYTFKNWNTAANGSGTSYNPGASYTANAAATLYAQWNSSTTTEAVTLPTPTRSGYTFQGWATSSSAASGATGSYTPSANVTLYAIWKANSYYLDLNGSLDGNSVSNITDFGRADIYINGTRVAADYHDYYQQWPTGTRYEVKNIRALEGYKYVGQASYSGTITNQSVGVSLAFVSLPSYTITFDANGGSGAPGRQSKWQDSTVVISSVKPTRNNSVTGSYTVTFDANGGSVSPTSMTSALTTNYTFKNWNTAANGSGTSYNPGASYTANENVTLYAQWNSSTTASTLTLPTPTRSGYSFKGWATSSSAASGVSGSYTPSGNVTLYAIWQKQAPDFVLPGALREVGEEAFAGAAFSYVHVPEQVTKIGKRAFADCPNLRNIDIPAETTAIDATAFEGVSDLTIHGEDGSYAEFYAVKYGFDFVAD